MVGKPENDLRASVDGCRVDDVVERRLRRKIDGDRSLGTTRRAASSGERWARLTGAVRRNRVRMFGAQLAAEKGRAKRVAEPIIKRSWRVAGDMEQLAHEPFAACMERCASVVPGTLLTRPNGCRPVAAPQVRLMRDQVRACRYRSSHGRWPAELGGRLRTCPHCRDGRLRVVVGDGPLPHNK